MPLPTFQAAGAFATSSSAAISPAWPTHQANDIGLLCIESQPRGVNLSVPAGFKEIPVSPRMTKGESGVSITQVSVYWKRATGAAEGAPTIEFASRQGTQDVIRAIIVTFRGCSIKGEPWNALASDDGYATQETQRFPGLTTTDPDCLIVGVSSHSRTSNADTSGWANAGLGSITERADSFSEGVGTGSLSVVTGTKVAAGSFGETLAVGTDNVPWAGITIALTAVEQTEINYPYIAGCGPVVESASANVSPAWPAGHQAGDIGFLIIHSGGYPLVLGTPAGFAEHPNSPQLSASSGASSHAGLHLFWKRATGAAEASPTVDFVANNLSACIFTVRGGPASGNPWDAAAGSVDSSSTTNLSFPAITVPKSRSLVLHLMGHGQDNHNRINDWDSWSNPNLVHKQPYLEFASAIGAGSCITIARGRAPEAGPIGNTTATNETGQQHGYITLSIPSPEQKILAEGGVFAFTGQDATLLLNRQINAEQGAFAFAGQDASLVITPNPITHRIEAERGLFNFEGQPAEFSIKQGQWERDEGVETIWTKDLPL